METERKSRGSQKYYRRERIEIHFASSRNLARHPEQSTGNQEKIYVL